MSQKESIETKAIGYRFHFTMDKELRDETGAKYPDKTNVHASIEGHTDTLEEAKKQLGLSKLAVEKALREAKL